MQKFLKIPMLEIEFQNPENYPNIPMLDNFITWGNLACDTLKIKHTVVVRVVKKSESRHLNYTYRAKNCATNVLSFPFEPPSISVGLTWPHLGDIVICEAIVRQEAIQQHKTLTQHWAHLFIHGLLHLQGYDHISDAEATIMETLEIKILTQLGFPSPYIDRNNET